jgi:sterol desaturase/sphingolipid hydroxylase (fatty acid hydroxylase superfamily)
MAVLAAAAAGDGTGDTSAPTGTVRPARHAVCDSLGFLCPFARELYWAVAKPSSPLNWLFLVSALLIATAVFFAGGGRGGAKGLFAFLFPRNVWLGRSALTDYQFYLSAVAIGLFVNFSALLVSAKSVGPAVEGLLVALGGARSASQLSMEVAVLYGILNVVAVDFGFFIAHYLMHRFPVLWEFHKVHHAAESLTPLTAYRFHPIEVTLGGASIGLCAGTVDGLFGYAMGGAIPDTIKILNYGAILFGVHLVENLRHSHIWLSYGWHVSHVLSSPAQHQIHHSCEPRHFDKNFAQIFSLWDWIFGTLYVPREKERFQMGLPQGEHAEYYKVWSCYVVPVIKVWKMMSRGIMQRVPGQRQRSG